MEVKLTKAQAYLLKDLRDSKARGAASMSVSRDKLKEAHELEEMKLIEWHGLMYGSNFYYATEKGMKVK